MFIWMNVMWRYVIFIVMSVWLGVGLAAEESPVRFADSKLKAVVEETLLVNDPTPTDMQGLYILNAKSRDIWALGGLEYAISLRELNLRKNTLSDLSPLSELTRLKELNLSKNLLVDISPLASLRWLDLLDMHMNKITDISALSEMTNLWYLVLHGNPISDITPLSDLERLQILYLFSCEVTDISPLTNLRALDQLYLANNHIRDISALTGLTQLNWLDLARNPLSHQAYCYDLYTITNRSPHLHLVYDPNRHPPEDIFVSSQTAPDTLQITWKEVCNGPNYTSYYRVYRALSVDGSKTPVSVWQTSLTFTDRSVQRDRDYVYWVRTSTSANDIDAGPSFGEPVVGRFITEPQLQISSSAGGQVTIPGEGLRTYTLGDIIDIQADAEFPSLFAFVGWTGTAVDAGKVINPNQPTTQVVVDAHYTLRARFVSTLDIVSVDAAAKGNIIENGTVDFPLSRIQDAIEVADDNVTIRVRPGRYVEALDFLGKDLALIGMDPNTLIPQSYPVIDANQSGPVVRFTQGEGPECLLKGFVLTGGQGGIVCDRSSPTLSHCLIVGNAVTDLNNAIVTCSHSQAALLNCTITDNLGTGLKVSDGVPLLLNSIVWGHTPQDLLVEGTMTPLIHYCDVGTGWSDANTLSMDPVFVRLGSWTLLISDENVTSWIPGDYHLQSQAGHWSQDQMRWIVDDTTSPCIDAGDPVDPFGSESEPNGERINLGAFGGTRQASRSPGNQ